MNQGCLTEKAPVLKQLFKAVKLHLAVADVFRAAVLQKDYFYRQNTLKRITGTVSDAGFLNPGAQQALVGMLFNGAESRSATVNHNVHTESQAAVAAFHHFSLLGYSNPVTYMNTAISPQETLQLRVESHRVHKYYHLCPL